MSVAEENSGGDCGGSVGRRRRRWSEVRGTGGVSAQAGLTEALPDEAQKRQIVAETHEAGVSVPMVAQRYNLNANQVFRWRRLFREPERASGTGRYVPCGAAINLRVRIASMAYPFASGHTRC